MTWLAIAVAACVPAVAGRRRSHTRRVNRRYGPWLLLATLGVLVAITIPELGADPWPFMPAAVHPHGLLGPLVRVADREWDLGILRSTAVLAGLLVALAAAATLAHPLLAALGRDRAPGRRLRDAARARGAPPGRAPRRDRALVLHERLDVPDRDRRRPRPARPQPVRPRLRELGARALLPGGGGRGSGVRPRGETPLRLLPGHGADRGRVARPPAALGRLPASSSCSRRSRCCRRRSLFPGAAVRAPGRRLGAGREPDPASRAPGSGPPTPPRCSRSSSRSRLLARGRLVWAAREPRRRARAQAVRARRGPVLRRHAAHEATCRARTLYRAGAAFGGVFLATVLPFLIADPGALWRRHGRLRRRHVPHRRLRPRRAAAQPRGDRRPLRLLPVRPARAPRLAPAHRVAPLEPAARRDALGGRCWFFRFDVRPAFPEPRVPELVPRLAFDRHRARALARFS